MHKDELIQLHTLLCQLRSYFEARGQGAGRFADYSKLGVSPIHVHKSKSEHKKAIFVLGKELADLISCDEFSGPGRMSQRLGTFVHRMDDRPKLKALEIHT
ncbi:MAG: UPF0058 family protein [Methanobacteriota archaeon]